MSIAATHWAFTLPIPATHKMVLLAYANHADDRGETWPGMDRLMRHTSLSERAIRRSKKWLTKLGLIAPVTTGKRSDTFILSVGMEVSEDVLDGQSGRKTDCESETDDTKTDYWSAETDSQAKKTDCVAPESSRTIKNYQYPPFCSSTEATFSSGDPDLARSETSGLKSAGYQLQLTPPDDPSKLSSSPEYKPSPKSGACDPEEFDAFWAAYPRKDGKKNARAAFAKARKKVSLERLVAAVKAYPFAEPTARGDFRPMPATWLNGERWEDDVVADALEMIEQERRMGSDGQKAFAAARAKWAADGGSGRMPKREDFEMGVMA
ncbi:helix-turn-helix domain-containing protein [Gluconobacter cerinus]|uniref:helix-turn-helix domain-containing protein n=1 Tax=Gluconobacter cerinus TaxID=38307 RepID=UPI001B8BADB0|nr:helix-turn-helix domain-containing protein [Gluconobacter cerinus]